jgi:hypothetical protein
MTDEDLDEMVRKADADMRKMLSADVYAEIKSADEEYLQALGRSFFKRRSNA